MVNIKHLSLLCTLLMFPHFVAGSQAEVQRKKMIADIEEQNKENRAREFAKEQHAQYRQDQQKQARTALQHAVKENKIEPQACFFEHFAPKVALPSSNFTSVSFGENRTLLITTEEYNSSGQLLYNNKTASFEHQEKEKQPQWEIDKFWIKESLTQICVINPKNQHVITLQFERPIFTARVYDDDKKIAIAFKSCLEGTNRVPEELHIYDIPQEDTPYTQECLEPIKFTTIDSTCSIKKIFFRKDIQKFIGLTINEIFIFSSDLTEKSWCTIGQVVAMSPCGKYVIINKMSDQKEENTYLYKVDTQEEVLITQSRTRIAAFGSSGLLVTVSDDGIMQVHPIDTKEMIGQLSGLPNKVSQPILHAMRQAVLGEKYTIPVDTLGNLPDALQQQLPWFLKFKVSSERTTIQSFRRIKEFSTNIFSQ